MDAYGNLGGLLSKLIACAIDNKNIERFLDELSAYSGGVATHIFGHDFDRNINLSMRYSGYAPEAIDEFTDYYAGKNIWGERFVQAQPGVPVSCEWMAPSEALVKSEIYNDWLRPQENLYSGGGVLLSNSANRMFALGGNIRYRDVERLHGPWMRLLGVLAPQLHSIFEISRILQGNSLAQFLASTARNDTAIVLTSNGGRLLHANAPAQRELALGRFMWIDMLGKLKFVDEEIGRSCRSGGFGRNLGTLRRAIGENGKKVEYAVDFMRVDASHIDGTQYWALIGGKEIFDVFIVRVLKDVQKIENILRRKYELTPREIAVTLDIESGMSPNEICSRDGLSKYTIRAQLKSAMTKLDVHRQASIPRKILEISDRNSDRESR
ncbi:MAG: response regulator transcription factor [Phyllobacteriaceae bacterium]|nr:response regulator transcription factor [Phyllobacteriaceae bacterium]